MTIVVSLSPELEARLHEKAAQQGQDVSLVASELLASVLEWEAQDLDNTIKGIQQGLDDFEIGKFRSFHEFATAQRRLLLELIYKRRVEQRYEEIARNAAQTMEALKAGIAKRGTLADLQADLLSQE